MAKLHIYKKIGKFWSKVADGDGVVDKNNPFDITIKTGSVSGGNTYDVRQGQSPTGTLCDCSGVHGKVATFTVSAGNALLMQEREVALHNLAGFYSALESVSKNVSIMIDLDDLAFLKTNDYALCFAKKVASGSGEGSYNVVWQSLTRYLAQTSFSWTPQYSLFGTNIFADNVTVTAQTNQQTVGLGEQCTLDENGILGPASTGGPPTSITLNNDYDTIHPALSQISVLTGVRQVTPLYVAPKAIVTGEAQLTPIDTVLVWFQQNISTSTMFSTARSRAVEIDLTNTNSATRLYQGQAWTTP